MYQTFQFRTKLIWIIVSLLGTSTVCFSLTPNCGGRLKSNFGVIITPNFPGKFPVPITCKWIIENTDVDVIVVYFTQLFVTSGLTIKEYAYYEDESSKYAEKVIFSADEKSVISELYVTTERPFLVIEFGLDRLDTNHVRALDNLLDVYGFNVTYDVIKVRNLTRMTSCSVATCSYNGHFLFGCQL
ncbi:hypothetical protein WDU94_002737 [Cyamophila willieti]